MLPSPFGGHVRALIYQVGLNKHLILVLPLFSRTSLLPLSSTTLYALYVIIGCALKPPPLPPVRSGGSIGDNGSGLCEPISSNNMVATTFCPSSMMLAPTKLSATSAVITNRCLYANGFFLYWCSCCQLYRPGCLPPPRWTASLTPRCPTHWLPPSS